MAVYGRMLEINMVWAEMLTIYHAVFSITIPILLVELAYPDRRNENWIGKKLLILLVGVLFALTVFGYWLFSTLMNYWTPLPQYLTGIAIMITFIYLARRLPPDWGTHGQKPLPKPAKLWLVTAAASFAFFLGFYSSSSLIPWPLAILYGILLTTIIAKFITRYNWKQKPNNIHVFALCSGALTFFLTFAPLQELDKTRTDNTQGMTLVAIATIIALITLRHKIKQQNNQQQTTT
jgi:heme A synthase